jgi:hypothetical protein
VQRSGKQCKGGGMQRVCAAGRRHDAASAQHRGSCTRPRSLWRESGADMGAGAESAACDVAVALGARLYVVRQRPAAISRALLSRIVLLVRSVPLLARSAGLAAAMQSLRSPAALRSLRAPAPPRRRAAARCSPRASTGDGMLSVELRCVSPRPRCG